MTNPTNQGASIPGRLLKVEATAQNIEAELNSLRARVTEAARALQGMLIHSCVSDTASEDKFPEDHEAERLARAFLRDLYLPEKSEVRECSRLAALVQASAARITALESERDELLRDRKDRLEMYESGKNVGITETIEKFTATLRKGLGAGGV